MWPDLHCVVRCLIALFRDSNGQVKFVRAWHKCCSADIAHCHAQFPQYASTDWRHVTHTQWATQRMHLELALIEHMNPVDYGLVINVAGTPIMIVQLINAY